jgi:hypothetical protein
VEFADYESIKFFIVLALGDTTDLVEGTDFLVTFGLILFEQKTYLKK